MKFTQTEKDDLFRIALFVVVVTYIVWMGVAALYVVTVLAEGLK